MPRPETAEDLPADSLRLSVGTIQVESISTDPTLLRCYASLVERVKALGGTTDGKSHVYLHIPKNDEERAEALTTAQRNWDANDRRYWAISRAELSGEEITPPFRDYEKYALRTHAEKEGYPQLRITEEEKTDA